MTHPGNRIPAGSLVPLFVILVAAVIALYGGFLSSPVVFDDHVFLDERHPEYLQAAYALTIRWLPYASIEWTRAVLGENVAWMHLGNLVLHAANACLLFLFLLRLFENVDAGGEQAAAGNTLSPRWQAFSAALLFALHPAAVYGVAYLIQRSILMATLFVLLSWLLFLEGVLRDSRRWLLASCAAYLLAVLSKEHAIMAPAVVAALLLLLRKPDRRLLAWIGPIFMLYGMAAVFVVFQAESGGIIGKAYEPNAATMLAVQGIDQRDFYVLSALTQGYLYFKYLLLWLVPNPGWMSVDMLEEVARGFWAWPATAGAAAFLLYPVAAIRLLLRRGRVGLLGFALICPWLLFATEFSTVRIQETFVIYRSYLWMPGMFAALPFLLHKVQARRAAILIAAAVLAMTPASWNRLTTFSAPLLLWDDALRLADGKDNRERLGRMYHNRGVAYSNSERYQEAIRDFDKGIDCLPQHSLIYNDRGVAYLMTGRYREALKDYDMAIHLKPDYYNPYLGRAQVHEALGNREAARQDYARSCQLGVVEVCDKAH